MVRLFRKKLQRGYVSLSQSAKVGHFPQADDHDHDDVKKGHFAVLAAGGGEPKRFIVELEFLSNPCFLRLLQLAEEEYGFQQAGALAVPCRPEVLEQLLRCQSKSRGGNR